MVMRPSRDAVRVWNQAYAEQTTALFAAGQLGTPDAAALARLASAYVAVAFAWRTLSADLAAPMWARHAAVVATEEFIRRAHIERARAERAPKRQEEQP